MNKGLKFASWLVALGLCVCVAVPADAQNRPPKNRPTPKQEQRQERRQERQQQRNANNPNRPPASQNSVVPNTNRPPERARNQQNPNRPPANMQPKKFENLNQEQKQRTLENNRDFQRRTPAEKERIRRSVQNWDRLTPEQKNHVKNDVLPQWRQLPPDRQRAIGSRLNVLQNMPESARNQHLADPNFTRGMNDQDKAMLQDLSHLHVGGAPDEPHE